MQCSWHSTTSGLKDSFFWTECILHVKLINIFWSRLYSAGSRISFSISSAVNKNAWVDVGSCVPHHRGVGAPVCTALNQLTSICPASLLSFSPQGQEGLQWKSFVLEVCWYFRVGTACYTPSSEGARWWGLGWLLAAVRVHCRYLGPSGPDRFSAELLLFIPVVWTVLVAGKITSTFHSKLLSLLA